MRTISFQSEHAYSGNKAVVRVGLTRPRPAVAVEMILDTGAEISILNRDLIRILGLQVHEGQPVELEVANRASAQAWVHPVEIEFLDRRLTIQAAICPDWDTNNYLGMRGFFDQLVIAFDHAQRRVYV